MDTGTSFNIEIDEIDKIDSCLEMQDALNDREVLFLNRVKVIHESGSELSAVQIEKIDLIWKMVANHG